MRYWSLQLIALLIAFASLGFAQVGNGTITGTVTDPTGAVIAGAAVQATNTATGVVYSAVSTNTGNYAIPNLPVGTYTVAVTTKGFKNYAHTNLAVAAAQTLREDVHLEVGTAEQSVTVTAEASLLKTESGELAHNVSVDQLDQLPLLGIGTVNAGSSGFRNPYNSVLTLPGVSGYTVGQPFVVNGLGQAFVSTETMRIDGQDATSRLLGGGIYDYPQITQPGADSIQEVSYQTSNYAAEYGQAGSVVINMTMKSGTNQYHGSGYDYFVNEDLNAGAPFSQSATAAHKYQQRNRRNDFGGTLGGPIIIPKLYNGRNKSFFFFSYEEYLETTGLSYNDTVPTTAYLNGDFSAISPNGTCSLCDSLHIPTGALGPDALGNPIFANEIYDPLMRGTINGQGYAMPFPGNKIPMSRFDPTSLKFAALFPKAENSNLTQNYTGAIPSNRYSAIPSIKIDQTITDKDKLSFYYSENNTQAQVSTPYGNADGLPLMIGGYRGTFIPTYTERLNYDRTITPTMLLHLGAGYLHTSFDDHAPFLNFDPSQYGLTGFVQNRQFPSVTQMCAPVSFGQPPGCGGVLGGMQNIGTAGQIQTTSYEEKPTMTASMTWVRGNHTFKLGGEMYMEGNIAIPYAGVTLQAGLNATAEPFSPTFSLNGQNMGFYYASFLLGDYSATTQVPLRDTRAGNQTWGLYLQDTWKITPKLTLDYGLRWDYNTVQHEQYGRWGQLDPNTANPNAGGRLGAVQYANTCNCDFYKSGYPYALGPRIGLAYQINNKTVLRAGWGLNYQFVASPAGSVVYTNGVYPLAGVNPYVNIQTPGSIVAPTWPVTDPFIYPNYGTTGPNPTVPDANQNRPPRINQWSIGIQREITSNLVVEASYVANRAAWLAGPYGLLNQIAPSTYAHYGLYPYPGTGPAGYNNDADRALLLMPVGSTQVQQAMTARGFPNFSPYASFNAGNTLMSALEPYPQFGTATISGSPTGKSKYDSLQIKVTKRFSHGLQAGGNFTWARGFQFIGGVPPPFGAANAPQDFFNHSASQWAIQQIPPMNLNLNFIYTVPKASFLPKWANLITRDWQIGGYANYQSGMFLSPPTSQTANFLSSEDVRVPGQPLYTPGVNINDLGSYNPYYTQVLNPKAWAQCPTNTTCAATTTFYTDFRAPRTPSENASFGRNFRFGNEGRFNLFIRAEFVNIFNRTLMPAPSTLFPQFGPSKNGQGIYTGGFGVINAYLTPGTAYTGAPYLQPRTGTLIARFSF